METHYYKAKNSNSQADFYQMNRFLTDYLEYII
jgi:uncharacterized protein YqiB (DUF1249 family)